MLRMKLCLGYGLDITDMNKEIIHNFEYLENNDNAKNFYEDALNNAYERNDILDRVFLNEKHFRKKEEDFVYDLHELIEYDSEFAFENKLLLYPYVKSQHWKRNADSLDIALYENYNKLNEPRWIEKSESIYPFNGFIRPNTSMPLGVEYCNEHSSDKIPMIPIHLWFLIKHLKLVSDDKITETFLKLRPTVLIYWS